MFVAYQYGMSGTIRTETTPEGVEDILADLRESGKPYHVEVFESKSAYYNINVPPLRVVSTDDKYRPPVEERWIDGMRTEPARIEVRTEWLYSPPSPEGVLPTGRKRHPFGRGGRVVRADVHSHMPGDTQISNHINAAIESFGDDKDLVVEVRLKDTEEKDELADLHERLTRALRELDGIIASAIDVGVHDEILRLRAKRSGVALALSYVEEAFRLRGRS